MLFLMSVAATAQSQQVVQGAIIRADTTVKRMAIVFTADEFGDGADTIINTLKQENVKASFFFTGRFYRAKPFKSAIRRLKEQGHYLGPHSDQHLLYCDWTKRDSLLVTQQQFSKDLRKNYAAMARFGIAKSDAHFFLPPFEWYNNTIAEWTKAEGLQLINFTPGTLSNADYTTPDMKNYRSTEVVLNSIKKYAQGNAAGLNGFILLLHFGTDPKRPDKLYNRLPELIRFLKYNGYQLVRIDELGLPSLP
ncbi:polysaccharide deacetylase family protein [Pseudoflavitalea sp. G-6-1-2]|uniref:polysaccharide deacetylase family protein n=1 Tax=Pseudoflavitalea sp. G-6-1-2 TaxID=2728841 RepID=UPI001F0DC8AD|nr:polysaccharide deacetylase family protein [Pseudoflavitalea sp. G-6-1-2]